MANVTPVIAEIIANYEHISRNLAKVTKPKLITTNLERGFDVSHDASSQPSEVAMTPQMRNLLRAFGDLKEDQRLMVNDPETKAEKWLQEVIKAYLLKYFPEGKDGKYDESKPLTDRAHLAVDNWHNLKENLRDIQPGQEDQRKEMIEKFVRPTKSIGLLQRLRTDVVFQKAVLVLLDQIPFVKATTEIREVNLPFMTKHTNVSYPDWQNDRNVVPGKNITYAELAMQDAEKLAKNPWSILDYNISTAYGRNQRGKGRLLIATSRRLNLVLNQLESEEISAYKVKSPLFSGYKDASGLKEVLIGMNKYCEAHGFKAANFDYDGYDSTVSIDWIILLGAVSMYKCNGERSKILALIRSVLMTKTWLVDGLGRVIKEIFGRIFSGELDTNRGGGIINAINALHKLMLQNPKHSAIVYNAIVSILVMGDDLNFIYDPKFFSAEQFATDMKKDGFEIKPSKYAFGHFFLQYRLFKEKDEYKMVYPATRVLRSMLFKETNKGLGPGGWILAMMQQAAKLIEDPISLSLVVNMLAPLDGLKLGLDMTVQQIIDMVNAEDKEASSVKSEGKRRRYMNTINRLYDGDPSKNEFYIAKADGDVEINSAYLEKIHSAMKAVYDENFIRNLGFKTPDIKFDVN